MDFMLAAVEKHRWTVTFNHRIMKWTVQEEFQVVGNIGEAHDIEGAILNAMIHHNAELEAKKQPVT